MAVLNASPAVVLDGFGFRRGPRRSWSRPTVTVSPLAALAVALVGAFLVALTLSVTVGRPVAVPAESVSAAPVVVETTAYPAWTVVAGDTLWSIARQTRPNADPRAVVLQIQVLNGLSAGHVLQSGEVLQLPTV